MINTDPKHKHTYDDHGNMTCCSLEEKVYKKAHAEGLLKPIPDTHDQHDRASAATESPAWRTYLPAGISFTLLVIGLAIDYFFKPTFFQGYARLAWYALGYLPVGWPVMKEAFNAIRKREVFTEFFLMSIATIGAFCIGEYPEAVAVMLFYAVGELFQSAAVNGAKRSIKALLDIRPDTAFVKRNNQFESV
jgi:Cd2+/Zn2+-exporting ATPase